MWLEIGYLVGYWLVVVAGVRTIAFFQAELSCDAFQLLETHVSKRDKS